MPLKTKPALGLFDAFTFVDTERERYDLLHFFSGITV
jgi:hypothetical protein